MKGSMNEKFIYGRSKGPLAANFAANMGDCAQIIVPLNGDVKPYKPRIVPTTPTSKFSEFLETGGGRDTPLGDGKGN